jgi:hypothetical protein
MGINYSHSVKREGRLRKEACQKAFVAKLIEQGYTDVVALDNDKLQVSYTCSMHGSMTKKVWTPDETEETISLRTLPACWHCGRGKAKASNTKEQREKYLTENMPHVILLESSVVGMGTEYCKFRCTHHGDFSGNFSQLKNAKLGGCPGCSLNVERKPRVSELSLQRMRDSNCEIVEWGQHRSTEGIFRRLRGSTIRCIEHDVTFKISQTWFTGEADRNSMCHICRGVELGVNGGRSRQEVNLYRRVLERFPEAVPSHKIRGRMEVDIYVPSESLGIEYNGTMYHSYQHSLVSGKGKTSDEAVNKHIEKWKLSKSKGIRLISIWEHFYTGNEVGRKVVNARLSEELKTQRFPVGLNVFRDSGIPEDISKFYKMRSPLAVMDADFTLVACEGDVVCGAISVVSLGRKRYRVVNLACSVDSGTVYKMLISKLDKCEISVTLPNDWYTDFVPSIIGLTEKKIYGPCGHKVEKGHVTNLGRDLEDDDLAEYASMVRPYIYFDSGSTNYSNF